MLFGSLWELYTRIRNSYATLDPVWSDFEYPMANAHTELSTFTIQLTLDEVELVIFEY